MFFVSKELIHAMNAERFFIGEAIEGNGMIMLKASLRSFADEYGGLEVDRELYFFTVGSDQIFVLDSFNILISWFVFLIIFRCDFSRRFDWGLFIVFSI